MTSPTPKRLFIKTYGCQMNVYDSERMADVLRPLGYATGGAVSSYVLRGSTGIGPAFEHYDDAIEVTAGATLGQLERSGAATVQAAWTWVDPILKAWEQNRQEAQGYTSGTWGPSSSIALIERDGRTWHESA